ncbi:DUF1345 domain-containing protein [Microbacterium karelineae]|uniref:DUF1345 domain-containing protein n=1 Tax=Microbacterium karelineae TaxID=2654283 RepID=UPI0012EAE672|nr:DUF1345 domain-containing protein [Microbacterium karelineae]
MASSLRERSLLAFAAIAPLIAFVAGARLQAPRGSASHGSDSPAVAPVVPERDADPRPPRWLASAQRRSWIATLAVLVPTAIFVARTLLDPGPPDRSAILPLLVIVGIVYTLAHSILTVLGLWGTEGGRLRRSVRMSKVRDFGMTSSARALAVQTPLVVLVVVAMLVFSPALRGETALVALTLAFVVSSWINMALLFAENYVDQDATGLRFPGGEAIGFSDYVYFSLSVQMTFGTTDVDVLTRAARRNVAIHGVTAFAFNTVIIAMIVSLLVSG